MTLRVIVLLLLCICFCASTVLGLLVRNYNIPLAESQVTAWARDSNFYYFGHQTGLTRVRISDNTRVGFLPLSAGVEQTITAICLDTTNSFGYMVFTNVAATSGLTLAQFSLNTQNFTRTGATTLLAVETGAFGGVCNFNLAASPTKIFVGVTHATLPAQIVQVDVSYNNPLSSVLVRSAAISLQEPEVQVNSVCVDFPTNTAFYGLNSNRIAVINMATFQRSAVSNIIDTAATGGASFGVTACIIDGANLYWGLASGHIVKVTKNNVNTAVGTVPRIQNAGNDVTIQGFGIDAGSFLYGIGKVGATNGILFKVDFATMAAITVQNLQDNAVNVFPVPGNFPVSGALATFRFLVAFSTASAGKMQTFDNTLARVVAAASVVLQEAITGIVAVNRIADNSGNIYLATNAPGTVWVVRQSDFAQIRKCSMNVGETIASIHADGTTLVVGTTAGDIVRFDVNCVRNAWNPTNVLGAGRSCDMIIQDTPVSTNVYCMSTAHTAIARVNKADATMAVTRVNFLNENQPSIAAYDPTTNVIYAVSTNVNPNPPTMIRFRLTDFVRLSTSASVFTGFPNTVSAIDVDTLGNVYVASGASALVPVRIFKLNPGLTAINTTFSGTDLNPFSIKVINNVVYYTNANGAPAISKLTRLDTSFSGIDTFTFVNNNGFNLRPFSSQTNAPHGAIGFTLPATTTPVVTFIGRDAQPVFWNIALCTASQYYDHVNDGCSCCPAGTFLQTSDYTCQPCPGGSFCPTCVTSGTSCSPGFFCPAGSATMTLTCGLGFTSGTGASQCTICPAGSYCPNNVTVTNCPAGTYNMLTGQTSLSACISCPAGTFSAAVGASLNTTCTPCTVGRVSAAIAATSCPTQCPPGSTNDPTSTFCTPCLPGTSNPNFAAACSDCIAGTYSSSFASLKCVACPAGTFNANTKATSCSLCPAGSITTNVGQTVCADCTAGQYQPLTGQTQCLTCPTGKFQNATKSTTCNNCPFGYSSGTGGQTGAIYCAACPPGTWNNQDSGNNDCYSCPTGTYTPFYGTTTRCFPCPAGQIPGTATTGIQNNGGTHCTLCPVGTYKSSIGLADSCLQCPAGWYQPNTGSASCLPCPAGLSSPIGSSSCTPCGPGQFSNFDAVVGGVCKNCPSGHVSAFYGSSNCTKCQDGFKSDGAKVMCVACPMGQYGRDGICAPCPVGTYSNVAGSAECSMCPPGTFQSATGSVTCDPCAPGTYAAGNGSQVCVSCLQGSYSTGVFQLTSDYFIGPTQCSLCPAGWTSSAVGSTQCVQCPKGTYGAFPGAACETCRAGTVSPLVQQTKCQICPAGTTSGITALGGGDTSKLAGEDTCHLCPVDTFSPIAGSPQCQLCPAGYFTNNTRGNSGCLTCGDGEYTGVATAGTIKHCIKCPPGKYLPQGVKAATCFDCPAGTFALGYGNTNCTPCQAGSKSAATAATTASTCTLCDIGTYSSAGSTACRQCPMGSFSFPASKAGATSCKFCPAGSYSNLIDGNVGETVCIPCPAGYYSANEGSHNSMNNTNNIYHVNSFELSCKPCAVGFYSEKAGSAQCVPCPQSTYTDTPASVTCKACPGNSYNTIFGATHFLNCTSACPTGWTNQAQNAQGLNKSDLCTPCPAGTFWNSFNSPCVPCPANTFNPRLAQTQCFACPNTTAIGSTSCCREVVNNGTTSTVCLSTGSFGKFFNPLYIFAALALVLSVML